MSSSSRRKMGLRAGLRSASCSVRAYRPTVERLSFDRPVVSGSGRQSPHSTSRSRLVLADAEELAVDESGCDKGA